MCAHIDEAIAHLREEKATITKRSLAEELGISERALYADYVMRHLRTYKEFNPQLDLVALDQKEKEQLKKENVSLKQQNREFLLKFKEQDIEIKNMKEKYSDLEVRYEKVLGIYQDAFGSKIIPF